MADGEQGDQGTPQQDPPPANGNAAAAANDGGGDTTDWKAEAEKWQAMSRKTEAQAKANAAAAKRLAEIEESQKTESQKAVEARQAAETEAMSAKRDLARLRVALRKGLTEAQAKRLVGETEEEMETDADELLASFTAKQETNGAKDASSTRPRERLRSGTTPGKEPEETDPIKLAAAVPR